MFFFVGVVSGLVVASSIISRGKDDDDDADGTCLGDRCIVLVVGWDGKRKVAGADADADANAGAGDCDCCRLSP